MLSRLAVRHPVAAWAAFVLIIMLDVVLGGSSLCDAMF